MDETPAAPTPGGPRAVALCGSLRDASVTRVALGVVLDGAEDAGATTELLDLRALELPPLDPDSADPEPARDLCSRVRSADAVVLGTPVYHHSYSGVLKNALDYCGFDEFADTTVGVVAVAGGGPGGFPSAAVDHLHGVAVGVRAAVHPRPVILTGASGVASGGELTDAALTRRLETLGRELTATVTRPEGVRGKS